jgi:hypothetical protein
MASSTDLSIFRFYTLWAETGHYPTSKYSLNNNTMGLSMDTSYRYKQSGCGAGV